MTLRVSSIQRFDFVTGKFDTASFDAVGNLVGDNFDIKANEGYIIYMKKDLPGFTP